MWAAEPKLDQRKRIGFEVMLYFLLAAGLMLERVAGIVMSGRRPLIKGYFRHCAGRGCGHVFGLLRGE